MSLTDITPQQCMDLAMTREALILDIVKAIDSDLVMLAKDEYAQCNGFSVKAERATKRLMMLTALIAPNLIDVNPEAE